MDRKAIAEALIADFGAVEQELNQGTPETVANGRRAALEAFGNQGIPTTKHEEWKYTSLSGLLEQNFQTFPAGTSPDLNPETIASYVPEGWEGSVMVFLNGNYQSELSTITSQTSPQIQLSSLREALTSDNSGEVASMIGNLANNDQDPFLALNSAWYKDGIYLKLEKGAVLEQPILVLHLLQDPGGENRAVYTRNLIYAAENSQGKIVEARYTLGDGASLSNHVSEIQVDQHARIEYFQLQEDSEKGNQLNYSQVRQQTGSNFTSGNLSFSGGLVRNNLNILLNEDHCESHMLGLYLLTGKDHVDNRTLVDHAQPNCYSNELYKGVLAGTSTGIFNGKIMVRPHAQKTNAFQSNKNLLLSPAATINTKPQLEIFADDVKCSHGATTGMLDQEALFYLRSRGLSQAGARTLLTLAFASEVVEAVSIPALRKHLEKRIASKLETLAL